MKILTVVGARPQFIKTAPVSMQFELHGIDEVLVHTGQHFDDNMSRLFFEEMGLKQPDYNLNINNLPHGALTGRMLEEIEKIIIGEKPDGVLVYGDTDSTLAGALAAKKLNVRLIHVEAGLRSNNMSMPEEINRIVTDRICDLLFCPTENAAQNLEREGIAGSKVVVCGDVMKDALLQFAAKARRPDAEIPENFVLCTLHRAENISNRSKLSEILAALDEISRQVPVVCPLHPHTKRKMAEFGIPTEESAVRFIEPVGYLEMLYLLNNCEIVLTDSGGLQKEAYFSRKFCVTMREETEWTELVENGYNVLAGSDKAKIVGFSTEYIGRKFDSGVVLYGDGGAAVKIALGIEADMKGRIKNEM